VGLEEEGGYLFVGEACDATTYAGDKEGEFGMGLGKGDKLIDVGTDGLYASLHRGDGITLTLKTDALTPDGTKLAIGGVSSSTSVSTCEVTTKHEYLVRL